jgi:hypothetical protein
MARKRKSQAAGPEFVPCSIRELAADDLVAAAAIAHDVNPANAPPAARVAALMAPGPDVPEPMALAVLTSKYWGPAGVKLGVAFLDNPSQELRTRILSHFNAWGQAANVVFQEASSSLAQVRVSRGAGGYWSYLGTDVLSVRDRTQPTMNLQGFTMSTPEAEYRRVVRHECGHTLGYPHEHLRLEVIGRLDVAKTLEYFARTQGWDERMTRSNVLTPLEERALIGTPRADEQSVMAYQLPGSICTDGKPIVGGTDINATDAAFCARLYPKKEEPPAPPPAGGVELPEAGTYRIVTADGKRVIVFN